MPNVDPMLLSILLPLAAGVFCLLIPGNMHRTRSVITIIVTVAVVALAWHIFDGPDRVTKVAPWLVLRIDALSGFVLLATSAFALLIALYSTTYMQGRERQREYFAYLLWTLGAAGGAIVANDLVILGMFWGFLGVTLYLMIGIAGPDAAEAARKSLLIVGGSDALLVLGVVLVWHISGSSRMDGPPLVLDSPAALFAFFAFTAAAFAKAGAVPLHSWIPDFGTKADAPVSAYLVASLDKLLGIYLLFRCVTDIFQPTPVMLFVLMMLGAITVLAGVMMALVQHDLKRLLAYHAVSQVGYMVLGIASGTAIGFAGGLFHMLNHTIYKCCLFLCAGAVEKTTGTTDLDKLGGLGRSMPWTFLACTVAALAISGIPPLNGFTSKWMVYQGIIDSGEAGGAAWIIWLAAAMLGSALTLASFVKVLHAVFLAKPAPSLAERSIREVGPLMRAPMVILAAACVIFGIFPFAIPLGLFILPAVGAEAPATWSAGLATMLIVIAIIVGMMVYWIFMRTGKLRRVETYIGGERMSEVHISAVAPGPERHVEVTGVNFFDTIEQLPVLRRLYVMARRRAFDLYDISAATGGYVIGLLRSAHTGILPAYLTWFLCGLLVVVYIVSGTGQ